MLSDDAVPVSWPEGVAAVVAAADRAADVAAAVAPEPAPAVAPEPAPGLAEAAGRPKRASALRAGARIRGVFDWEDCDESSERFQTAAAEIEVVFDREREALAPQRAAEEAEETDSVETEADACAAAAKADAARAARAARIEAAAAARAARTVLSDSEDAASAESTGSAEDYSDGSEESSEDGSYESSFVSKSDDSEEESDEEAQWNPSASHVARARVEARAALAANLPVAPAAVDVWTSLPAGVDAAQDVFACAAGVGCKRPRSPRPEDAAGPSESGSGDSSPLTAANLAAHVQGLPPAGPRKAF